MTWWLLLHASCRWCSCWRKLGEELEEVKVRENVNDVEGKLYTRFDYVGASQR